MLNHLATEFVPLALQPQEPIYSYNAEVSDEDLTEEELEELEMCDQWVQLMADLDQLEQDHLIATALELAPAAAWYVEEEMAGISHKPRRHAGKKGGKGKSSA
mmetsp:Transcript_16167/g.40260  ORF Transcript_16167/g.40260 Transcript_16167/m.40260 type:complete len:103 (-) Transcript_16167:874-1182(-)|eukprot:CAMPEP_0202867764 /NCGR_PEP_ID=MMETSP1391-20130828/9605_1 /ASSEMBLY_ACC=CAM_ASM_000867 /TAXON_ID=1034604 /ORGANISM="Chlamydomonas leiostraca, Strain SAG 11-49" /LENGTH=102 /DNA_ID=CAMNT_0049547827 /DNA_START=116 /DNA_END=424 /DNA_ORIENTATION=+